MKSAFAAIALLACGTRTELAGEIAVDAASGQTQIVCKPGDPPLVLATTGGSGPLATDGAYVYGSSPADVLWSISAAGGARTPLWFAGDASSSTFELTAADDGVYADIDTADPSAPNGGYVLGVWLRHDGLASHVVHSGAFAPPNVYFAVGDHVQMAPLDSSSAAADVAVVSAPSDIASVVGVTSGKVYVQSPFYGECFVFRIDRSTATVESFHPNDPRVCGSVGVASGPNAVCGLIGCILDEQMTPTMLHSVLTLDATYAYAAAEDGVHRIALRGDTDDLVTPLKASGIAVANGCVYVQTPSELVRIAAPP